ncbi:MAG TPA: SigE family RNA polymerase sigma factor [Actinomycetota bacterium]|nr:SigE family RNA polymerase sigma factor [Actinomycetota bacterium]
MDVVPGTGQAATEHGGAASRGASASPPVSFVEFFEAWRQPLFRAVYLMTGNREEAEEIVQEAFVRVLERWDRVAAMERPEGYLFRAAMNLHRNRRRSLLRAPRRASEGASADEFTRADERDAVARALAALPPRQRAAVVLTELFDFSAEETGGMLGIRAGTVRAHVHQARRTLRDALGDRDG